MLSKLPPRERQIVDVLYERGPLAVAEIGEALPVQLSGSAIRAMLKRLEDKGYVRRGESDRGFLYSPVVSDTVAKRHRQNLFQRFAGERRQRFAGHVGQAQGRRARRP
jgi:predicted transcriptional regulator